MYFDYVINTKMNSYILSPTQKKIINSSTSLVNVNYRDVNEALHTIGLKVLKNCYELKSTVVVIKNPEFRARFDEYLKKLSINDLALFISIEKAVSEQDLNVLRDRSSSKKLLPGAVISGSYLYDTLQEKIKNHFQALHHNKIFDHQPWTDLLVAFLNLSDQCKISVHNDPGETLNLDFTKSEYEMIAENISDALFLYQRDFELNAENHSDQSQFHPSIDHQDDFHNISYTLFGFKEEACLLAVRYTEFLNHIEHLYVKSFTQYLDNITDKINLFIHSFDLKGELKTSPQGYFSVFSSSKNKDEISFLHQVNSLIYELKEKGILENNFIPVKKSDDILDTLRSVLATVQSRKNNIPHLTKDFLKSVNKLNYLDQSAEILESDLNDLLLRINESNLFSSKYETNTLSIKKQQEFVHNIIHILEVAILSIEKNMGYYQWKSFLEALDEKSKCIIQQMKSYDPAEWREIFSLWYYHKMLQKNFPYTDVNTDTAELLDQYLKEKERYTTESCKNRFSEIAESAIVSLKKDHPELYSTFIKRKPLKSPVLWKNYLAHNAKVISSLFPVVVADSDDMNDLKNQSIDEIIYLDFTEFKVDMMNLFHSAMFFFGDEAFKGIPDYELKKEKSLDYQTLKEIHTTGRISLVRNITNELLQFEKEPSVYRLRDATMISFCSDYYNERLNDYFYSMGIKKLHGDNMKDTITGALLDNQKDVFIITEDGLFNHDVEKFDFLMQKMVIEYLKDLGCEWIDIDNKTIFETKGASLEHLFSQIKLSDYTIPKSQNQLSIEFN